jgi:hypothetical protein
MIRLLAGRGWSERRIARELDVHRKTVRHYLKCTGLSPGSVEAAGDERPSESTAEGVGERSKCTTPSPGSEAAQEPGAETIVDAARA